MADRIVSTDATAILAPPVDTVPCAQCGAPLALDQRYCLECGTRRTGARSEFLDGLGAPSPPARGVPIAPAPEPRSWWGGLSAIAGVGVLLLAMGVGVLIGRSGSGGTVTAPAQTVSVLTPGVSGGAGAANAGAAASGAVGGEGVFSDDWPAGKNGYTVQLQSLPVAGTQPSEVSAAKAAASAKGAQGVGALRSSDYQGLPTGLYVIYTGVYSSETQAKQAIGPLKAKFPGATAIHVDGASKTVTGAGGAGAGTGTAPKAGSGGNGGGSSNTTSTPAATPKGSSGTGQGNEQKSLHLPNVVSTG